MRRLGYFWKGLPFTSKLQYLAMLLVLGSIFVQIDMHPARRAFGLPLWKVTGSLICASFVLARLLLPLMMARPILSQRILSWFGMSIFLFSLISMNQRWGRMLVMHLTITVGMWLDVWCSFWFTSEIQRKIAALRNTADSADDDADDDSDYDSEDDAR
ncbi:MAG: hypothetical protein U0941_23540 [Planctomycetaceae bacterium]